MMYPGVFLQSMIGRVLHEGRAKYIEQKRGQRAVIQTNDSFANKIDTMFVDKRNVVSYSSRVATLDSNSDPATNGKYLVICCDGNASFYEIGLLQVPIENGFSVLGWNYPGFGQSTVRTHFHLKVLFLNVSKHLFNSIFFFALIYITFKSMRLIKFLNICFRVNLIRSS
jgi:hypothetical protein